MNTEVFTIPTSRSIYNKHYKKAQHETKDRMETALRAVASTQEKMDLIYQRVDSSNTTYLELMRRYDEATYCIADCGNAQKSMAFSLVISTITSILVSGVSIQDSYLNSLANLALERFGILGLFFAVLLVIILICILLCVVILKLYTMNDRINDDKYINYVLPYERQLIDSVLLEKFNFDVETASPILRKNSSSQSD